MSPLGDERVGGVGEDMPPVDGLPLARRVAPRVAADQGAATGSPVAAESVPSSTAASLGIFGLRSGAQPPRSACDPASARLVVEDRGRGMAVAVAWGTVLAVAAGLAAVAVATGAAKVLDAAAPSAVKRRVAGLGACG
jgi:hypothetical protein